MEPGNVFILFEYCPKGSLMDILQDERVPLNWAFRFLSIVHTHHTANVTLAAVRLEAQVPQHCPHTPHSERYTR